MIHLDSFTVVHYRGIDDLSLPSLSKANLITGENGIGKTALLEAMWLFTGRQNPGLLWNPNVQRFDSSHLDPISQLSQGKLELEGVECGTHHRVKFLYEKVNGAAVDVRMSGTPEELSRRLPPVVGFIRTYLDGERMTDETDVMHVTPLGGVLHQLPFTSVGLPICVIESTRFQHETPAEILQRFSSLVLEGRKNELVEAINLVAEGIEDVEILTNKNGDSYLSVAIGGERPRPIHDLGGGAVRLVRLLLSFSVCRNGILLSDELENGIHHSVQRKIWDGTRQWMKLWNVQFVATTHSREFIDAAIDAFAETPEDLSIHKIFRDEGTGKTKVATFTGEALLGARDLNLEVR